MLCNNENLVVFFSLKWEEGCAFVDFHGPHGELERAAVRGVRWAAEAPETHTASVYDLSYKPELSSLGSCRIKFMTIKSQWESAPC